MHQDFFFGKVLRRALAGVGLCGVVGITGAANAAAPDGSVSALDQFAWHKRLLLVFAPSPQTTALARQREIIAENHAGFADRDIVTIEVVGDKVSGAAISADSMRRHYDVPEHAFQVLLVGKDTGVKIRTDKPLAATQLSQTIDAMPMRQQETRSAAP